MNTDNIPDLVKAVAEYHAKIRGGVIYWVKPGEKLGEEQLVIVYGRESEAGCLAGFSDGNDASSINARGRGRDNVEYVKRKFAERHGQNAYDGCLGPLRDNKDLINGSMLYHITGTFGDLYTYYIREDSHAK